MKNVLTLLKERGFIQDITDKSLYNLTKGSVTLYCGFDPTGDSLHIGHLIPIMGLAWFQKFGHKPVALVGGATGMIGDPSGKSKERNLLDEEAISKNVEGIKRNLEQLLSFKGKNRAILLNNASWLSDYALIPFLREVGKQFRIGPMLAKESVKVRLETEEGMSFTEFCYQVLQGYDFLYLYQNYGVTLQIGGSDQWGNITAGCELVRKTEGESVHGLTFPLLTRSDGKKFGKTEDGTLWLSPKKTSPYELYQYFYRMPDLDVILMMKLLTFMDLEEIKRYELMMQQPNYTPNTVQKKLAEEVTRILHGDSGVETALKTTEVAKPGKEATLNISSLQALKGDIPFYLVPLKDLIDHKIIDIIVTLGLQKSKGEARRLIRNGGLYLNNEKISNEELLATKELLIEGEMLLVSLGKKNRVVIQTVG